MWTDTLEQESRERERRIRSLPLHHPEREVATLDDRILARHLRKDPTEEPHASEWLWRQDRPFPWYHVGKGWKLWDE